MKIPENTKLALFVSGMIVALVLAIGGFVKAGQWAYYRHQAKIIQYENTYYAAALYLGSPVNYQYTTCVNDTSKIQVRKDSIIFLYRNKDRVCYKYLHHKDSLQWYGIRKDGTVVEFRRFIRPSLPKGKRYEMLMITQPELKILLNAYEVCP